MSEKPVDKIVVNKIEHKKQSNGQYRSWNFYQCEVREVESKDNKTVGELFFDFLSRNCRVFVEVKK